MQIFDIIKFSLLMNFSLNTDAV